MISDRAGGGLIVGRQIPERVGRRLVITGRTRQRGEGVGAGDDCLGLVHRPVGTMYELMQPGDGPFHFLRI